jgi:N4-(beta-N-acetylglucosaminyl)-L-asparaginase
MAESISRRRFFLASSGIGAGLLISQELLSCSRASDGLPLIVTDHTNKTGEEAVQAGWRILSRKGSALDAVEKAANVIEVDPEDTSVGYGGLPNEQGVVQLDASIMDGRTYNAGSVACLENIKTPSSVARLVMEKTDHVMMVGRDALNFAKKWGFKEDDLMTEKSRKIWLRWKENLSDRDDWGPADHLREEKEAETALGDDRMPEHLHGTTNLLAVDINGDIAGITTTSGLAFKIPGRVGDSPIIGAGLYVDNEVGAAGATGRGEDVIKSCATYYIVMRMKQGRSPQDACYDAMEMIADKYRRINSDFLPGEKFVAVNKNGEFGCARMPGKRTARMTVRNHEGVKIVEGVAFRS